MTVPSPASPRSDGIAPRIVRRPTLMLGLLVLCGATIGTLARASLSDAFPHSTGAWPWTTFWINLAGSFVLGALLESLALAGADEGWRRTARLGFGTGVLGGFTTYSTFVVEIDRLTRDDHLALAMAYTGSSLIAGITLAALGMAAVGAVAGSEPLVEDGDAA